MKKLEILIREFHIASNLYKAGKHKSKFNPLYYIDIFKIVHTLRQSKKIENQNLHHKFKLTPQYKIDQKLLQVPGLCDKEPNPDCRHIQALNKKRIKQELIKNLNLKKI